VLPVDHAYPAMMASQWHCSASIWEVMLNSCYKVVHAVVLQNKQLLVAVVSCALHTVCTWFDRSAVRLLHLVDIPMKCRCLTNCKAPRFCCQRPESKTPCGMPAWLLSRSDRQAADPGRPWRYGIPDAVSRRLSHAMPYCGSLK
jgi:hypothetical protein